MGNDETYNASDERQVAKQEKLNDLERKQELEDIRNILKRPAGVRFFRRLMEKGSVFQSTFRGNSNSFFLEGHRNLALIFFNDIAEADPEKIAEIMIKKKEKTNVKTN